MPTLQDPMKRIDHTTIYTSEELKEILHNVVSIQTLRHYGLVGSPGSGYWGQNVIDAMNNFWNHLQSQRKSEATGKESHAKNEKSDQNVQTNTFQSVGVLGKPVESGRQEFERLKAANKI